MNLGRLRARTPREQVILLLLPVLAFRLLFPAGFMPRFGDHLELSMQMCHGDPQSSAVMRMLGDAPASPAGKDDRHEAPCAFATLGSLAAVELPPATPVAAVHDEGAPRPAVPAPSLRLTHRSQSARAPPLTV